MIRLSKDLKSHLRSYKSITAVMTDDRYVFLVEWFDSAASLVRSYNLTYYAIDGTIDMVADHLCSSTSKTRRSSSSAANTPASS